MGHRCRRRSSRRSTGSTSTGTVGGLLIPEINDGVVVLGRREQQVPVGLGPPTRSADVNGAKQLPPCWCPCRCVLRVNGIHQVVVSLEFHAVIRRTSVWGAVFNVPPVIQGRSKNQPKNISPGVLMCEGLLSKGGVLSSVTWDVSMAGVTFFQNSRTQQIDTRRV